jgi:hypothetical protein
VLDLRQHRRIDNPRLHHAQPSQPEVAMRLFLSYGYDIADRAIHEAAGPTA